MINTFFGTKIETSQTFDKKGNRLVITKILAKPLTVAQIKTLKKDGYWALKVNVNQHQKEIRLSKEPDLKLKDQIKLSHVFKPQDKVKIAGLTKGRGFAGVIKRWGFAGGPRTHGQSDRLRAPGSIGQGTDPGRVWKGKKMPGRFGHQNQTIANLKVLSIDSDSHTLTVSGTVPGSRHTLLTIKKMT